MRHLVFDRKRIITFWLMPYTVFIIALFFLLPASPAQATHEDPIVVSLGDSYSSGEGNELYYNQIYPGDKTKDYDWLAHRSMYSWPGQLVVPSEESPYAQMLSDPKVRKVFLPSSNPIRGPEINGKQITFNASWPEKSGAQWRFAAATGATTYDILNPQKMEFNQKGIAEKSCYLPPQIYAFSGLKNKVDYVTITIGGNDIRFADIVLAAAVSTWLSPKDFDKQLQYSRSLFPKVKEDLETTYRNIRLAAGSRANILVVGYPTLINEKKTGIRLLSSTEAKKINKGVIDFNNVIASAVYNYQYSYSDDKIWFINVVEATDGHGFMGHEAYTSSEFINGITYGAQPNELDYTSFYSSKTMHPNKAGMEEYAWIVQQKINEIDRNSNADVSISLVFDVSGSMENSSAYARYSKLESAKEQSKAFVNNLENQAKQSNLSSQVGVVTFSDYATVNIGLTDNYGSALSAINNLHTVGLTNMYAGLQEGIRQLENTPGQKIMVYLSDGVDTVGNSDSSILDLAQQAANRDIKIYTIGFGSSGDLNEYLLQRMASITGGEYAHEDPSSLTSATVGIMRVMLNAQFSATGQVLVNNTGTVAQGGTSGAIAFTVGAYGNIQTVLYWPGSILELTLVDPDGVEVAEGYPGYTTQMDGTLVQVDIEGAKQGDWSMTVYGADVSMAEEPFCVITGFQETEAPLVVMAGGGAQDNGSGFLIVLVLVAIIAVGGVFAYSVRKKGSNKESTKL